MNEQLFLALAAFQAAGCALAAGTLWGLWRGYRRGYLRLWTVSWVALCVYHVGAGSVFLLYGTYSSDHPLRLAITALLLATGFVHAAWLAFGSYELASGQRVPRRLLTCTLIALASVALLTTWLSIGKDQDTRIFLRVGVRSLFAALGLFGAAYGVWSVGSWKRGFGRGLLFGALCLYGLEQLNYVARTLGSGLDWNTASVHLGLIDMLLQIMAALGMVLWHQEEDRGAAAEATAALRESEARLRQSQKMEVVGRLAGGVAHDFNNVLTAILGYAELLERTLEGGRARGYAEQVLAAGLRGKALTAQLLAFSRKHPQNPRTIDVGSVVEGMRDMLSRLLGADIELAIETSPETYSVHADPVQIEQVLLNLALNGRDAMPEGGRLSIAVSNDRLTGLERLQPATPPAGDYVCIEVVDSGRGMDEDTLRRAFEPFFTTKPVDRGTGLGLSTVATIAAELGGGILLDSRPERGTRARVYFPRQLEPAGAVAAETGDASSVRGTELVLVVDDEAQVRALICAYLDQLGYRTLAASGGAEALELVRKHPEHVDLMLTDLSMPGMNGRELALTVRLVQPDLKILYMSGYADDELARRGADTSELKWLQKPFRPMEVARAVRASLDGIRQA